MSFLSKTKALLSRKTVAGSEGDIEKKALDWVTDKWGKIKSAYTANRLNIWRARLFYCGEFWIETHKGNNGISWQRSEPKDDFVPQPKINVFSPAVDSVASNFNSVPEIEATPKPKDDERAIAIAEICNELSDFCIRDNALRADYKSDEDKAGYASQEFVLSGGVYTTVHPENVVEGQRAKMESRPGYSYQCVACDVYEDDLDVPVEACPKCGQPVNPIESDRLVEVKDEQGQTVMEDIIRKKIVVRVGDPVCNYPRPKSKSMANTPFCIWAERLSLDEIWQRFNYEADADNQQLDGFSSIYENLLNSAYAGYGSVSSDAEDAALVLQAYVEPGKMKAFPDGFYAVVINGKMAKFSAWKEEFCEHPLTKIDFVQAPGLFFPRSIAFDMAEVQSELCEYESLIKLHAKTSAVEPPVIDENTIVSEITGRCDKIIRWRSIGPGSKEPHRMKHGVLDPQIYEKAQELKREMQNINHAVSVFRGEQPGSVTAASAIATLRSQAEMQYSKPVSNWSNGWKETVRKVVKNYQKYFTIAQLAEIVGNDKVTQINLFKEANLDSCIEWVASATGLPKTRDEKRQELMTLYDKQALDLNDPNVKQKVFELFGDTGMMKTFNADARRARLNITRIRTGQQPVFRPEIDDVAVHLGIALETAKSLDFDSWPPEAQGMLMQYISEIKAAQSVAAPPNPGAQPPVINQGQPESPAMPLTQ